MKIYPTMAYGLLNHWLPKTIMKSLIFFFTIAAFSLNPKVGISQNVKIDIDSDRTVSIEEIFNLIKSQTDCKFVYRYDLIKDAPLVSLEKGKIKASELLERGLNPIDCTFQFDNNTIIVSRKTKPISNDSIQEETFKISGVVKDEQGNTLPGISVYVSSNEPKGTDRNKDFIIRGTTTGLDGEFEIDATLNYYLVLTGVVYELYYEQITSIDKKEYEIVLKELSNQLDEVVVVGYGTTVRKDLTGSVSSVKATDIKEIKTQTVDQALVGQMSGVFVNAQSGGPGGGAVVNIRGLSQIIGDNQPLYVIDGVPIQVNPRFSSEFGLGVYGNRENPLLTVNPSDIERVDVLKDASAAAIYGSRAANGVIVITTKKGKKNTPTKLNFSYNAAFQNPLNTYDLLSGDEYRQFFTDQGLVSPIPLGDANTDWQEKITNKNAFWQDYNLSISGGGPNMSYLVSGIVSNQEGIMLGNRFKRYSFTSNLDANITNRLNLGVNFSYNHGVNKRSGLTSLGSGAFFRPDLPVYNPDGSYTNGLTPFGFLVRNPLGDQAKVRDKAISGNLLGSVYGQFKILDELNFRSQLSLNLSNDKSEVFSPSYTLNALFGQFFGTSGALLDVQHSNSVATTWSNTLNFNKTFAEDHLLNAVVGLSYDYSRMDLEAQSYDGFPDDDILTNINSANNVNNYSSDATQTALNSVFGRFNYNYKDRYLATFTARYDGSIKFGPNNQYGFFPSGALAWNIHNESFLESNETINQLKLRASLGRTGLDNLPAFTFISTYGSLSNQDSFYDSINGIVVDGVPNSDIRWEETDQLDLGLEFSLFNNRLSGEVVYFEKKTSDIILLVPLPAQTGSSNWNANVADVTNKGWEITIGGDIIRSEKFRWNSSFNISFIDNKVDALNGGATSPFGSTGIIEGEPIGVINGYQVSSIAQTQSEIDELNGGAPDGNYYSGLAQPGDYIFSDINGDGEITNEDRTIIGNINPDHFGGWNNSLTYKNFDFNFSFNYTKGNQKVWSEGDRQLGNPNPTDNIIRELVYDSWTPENTNAYYARFGSQTHQSFPSNSRSVRDGSYIKLRSASLGFNFPKAWLYNSGIENVRFSLSGNNLFTITDYPGIDPESISQLRGGSTVDSINDEGLSYPQARVFTIGLEIGL